MGIELVGEREMEEAATDVEEDRPEKKRGGVRRWDGIPRIWGNSNG